MFNRPRLFRNRWNGWHRRDRFRWRHRLFSAGFNLINGRGLLFSTVDTPRQEQRKSGNERVTAQILNQGSPLQIKIKSDLMRTQIISAAIKRDRRIRRNDDAARRFKWMHFEASYVIPEKPIVDGDGLMSFVIELRGRRRLDFADRKRRRFSGNARSQNRRLHHQRLFIADRDRGAGATAHQYHRQSQNSNTPSLHIKDLYAPASDPADDRPADACEYDKLPAHHDDYSS
ncbi:hypothetical protein D3C76_1067700 [compost metagenome]